MELRTLRKTDLTVSRICLGAMTFGGQTDEAAAAQMVNRCLDSGINFFDTANVYTKGASEEITGRLLKGRRQELVLASKLGSKSGGAAGPRLTAGQVVEEVEKSLARLQTDYLDIYYLHQPDYETPVEETLEAMDTLVREGKVRYPATSNYASWQVAEMLGIAAEKGYRPANIAQQMYNLLARRLEPEFLPMAAKKSVSLIVYNPLAGGLLTGKHERGTPTAGTRFDGNQQYQDRYWLGANFDAVEKLITAARAGGLSLVELSLSWLLNHTAADVVILGASRLDHLEQNLAVSRPHLLSDEALNAIDEAWAEVGGVAPEYNR
jgi:1-deoxyxylulose-5-phosphate synthase